MDFVESHPIPDRLTGPLRAALRGEADDWPELLSAAEVAALTAHGVAPLLFAATDHASLRDEAIRAAAVESLRADDVRSLIDLLREAGVDALITKGGALAYDIYPAPELRPRGDTDLLVAPDATPQLRDTMAAAGFSESRGSGDDHGMQQALFTRRDRRGFVHVYDVHWGVSNASPFAAVLRFEDAWARSIPLPRLGAHARGLSPEDALLLACIHRVAHHYDSDRLIWLVDIALLRDRMSGEEHRRFWRAAADAKVVGVCSRSIALADHWLSRQPAHGAAETLTPLELEREEPSSAFLARDIRYGEVMLANLRGLPWRARLQRLRQLAFPPAAFMRESADGSDAPLAWLWARRGVRGIRRLFVRAASTKL